MGFSPVWCGGVFEYPQEAYLGFGHSISQTSRSLVSLFVQGVSDYSAYAVPLVSMGP